MLELDAVHRPILCAAVFAVAFFYSSVGHGGATGYLPALALPGTHLGARRWNSVIFSRALAGILIFPGGNLLIEATAR